jgi:ABC-type transport system substrate-binding protein
MNSNVLRPVVLVLTVFIATASFCADRNKVLHVASTNIETLDPQRWNDDPSYQIQFAIFEGLYEWDYLGSPSRLVPNTATASPTITDDGRTWTIRVKPGTHFTADPAFEGVRRELVAEDYVYSLKRVLDPASSAGTARSRPTSSSERAPSPTRQERKDSRGYRLGPDAKPLTLTLTCRQIRAPHESCNAREAEPGGDRLQDGRADGAFQDAIKEVMAGGYQMFFGAQGVDPTGWIELRILYGKSPPTTNLSRFSFPEYDRAAEQFMRAATESERVAAARTMSAIANNYAPFLPLVARLDNWFVQPWISGFSPPVIQTHWKYMDIDVIRQSAKRRGN